MADSDAEQTRESRFSKALIARVVSVGLFVALGTTAVVFMMGKPKAPATAEAKEVLPKENGKAETPGFSAQVKASFAQATESENSSGDSVNSDGEKKNPLSSLNSPNNPPPQDQKLTSDFPAFNPTKPPTQKDSLNDASPSPPLERFASLDNRLARPDVPNEAPPNNVNPVAEKNPAGSFMDVRRDVPSPRTSPEGAPGIRSPGNDFNPHISPVPQSNQEPPRETKEIDPTPKNDFFAPKTKPLTERMASEPLKPFAQPDLPNRMMDNAEPNSPNLKAPAPNAHSDESNAFPARPQSAVEPWNRSAADPSNTSGILKPFEPPVDAESGQEPKPLSSSQRNEFAPISNPQDQAGSPNSAPDSFTGGFNRVAQGNPEEVKDDSDSLNSSNPNRPSPNQLVAQPPSVPVSNGSLINQPASNPNFNRNATPIGFGGPSTSLEPKTANTPGERRLEGVQAPSLTVEKLSPKEVSVNEIADFIVVIRNVGRVDANDVVVHDQVPANTEFQRSEPAPQPTSDRKLSWDLGSIKAGQEKRIQYQLKPVTPGEIGSVAHVTFSTQASMRTLVTQPVLEINHRTQPVAMIGSNVQLDVVISNKGNGPAKSVLIQEDVPPQLQFQEGFRELEYELGNLMPGQTKRVQLILKAVEVGRLKNVIIATAAGGQRAQHELEMEVVAPKLVVNSDGATKRYLGRQVTHQFKLANSGTASATNVDLIAKLPPGLRFVKADNQGVYRQANHAVYWSMAELTAKNEVAVELITTPVDIGTQDIRFDVTADLNQTASVVQPLNIEHLVDIFFDIDDLVDPIEVGADTAYQIKIANQGTQLANNIQMQIEFPNGILPTTVESNLQNQVNGQRVQFAPINNLKPSEQLTVVIRAKGQIAGDHRVVVTLQADGRQTAVAKEEITRVYSDR